MPISRRISTNESGPLCRQLSQPPTDYISPCHLAASPDYSAAGEDDLTVSNAGSGHSVSSPVLYGLLLVSLQHIIVSEVSPREIQYTSLKEGSFHSPRKKSRLYNTSPANSYKYEIFSRFQYFCEGRNYRNVRDYCGLFVCLITECERELLRGSWWGGK